MAFGKKKNVVDQSERTLVADEKNEKKNARPEPQRRRSETLKIRLTPEELSLLTERAHEAGMTKTDYIMTAAATHPVIVIDEVPKLIAELRRQGVNLNQAIRMAYQTGSADFEEIKAAVKLCTDAQKEVLDLCERWNMRLRNQED